MKKIILLIALLLFSILLVAACDRKTVIITKPLSSASPFVWSIDVRCANCHATEVKSMTNPVLLASKHVVAGNSCSDCHNATDLQKAHKNIDAAKPPYPVMKYSGMLCFKCHGSYADIIKLTKDRARLNPHDSHYGEIECFICHTIHTAKSPDKFCVSCHGSMN